MTTPQIVILTGLAIVIAVSFLKAMLAKEDGPKFGWGTLQMIATGLLFVFALAMTWERERCIEESKGKCPEYEHIDAYRLKE